MDSPVRGFVLCVIPESGMLAGQKREDVALFNAVVIPQVNHKIVALSQECFETLAVFRIVVRMRVGFVESSLVRVVEVGHAPGRRQPSCLFLSRCDGFVCSYHVTVSLRSLECGFDAAIVGRT